jgi:pyruvate/2-oxoacid:ferredoxin oxidoreductase alpha subunit
MGFGSGVYPITPQTECIELLCAHSFEKGEVVRVESEHSAMAVCIGFSLAGARSFTASASNGLAYMCENVFSAALYRLPIVMMAANRTLGPPWNIWVDHGDSLMLRDSGWIQFFCEDNQEVLDTTLLAFRLAEDPRILLPVLVNQDAFVLSHTMMQTEIPSQELVDQFLPQMDLPHRIGDTPVTIGGLDFPHETEVHRKQHAEAMARVPEVYEEVRKEFVQVFGREPAGPVVSYRMEDAEIVFVSMGTTGSTVRTLVDRARDKGIPAGGIRIRMFRPFPGEALRKALQGAKKIAVLDRNISLGLGGVTWSELKDWAPKDALVQDYMIGLGGGDIRPEHLEKLLEDLRSLDAEVPPKIVEVG